MQSAQIINELETKHFQCNGSADHRTVLKTVNCESMTCLFTPVAHFSAGTRWTPGKNPMLKFSPHSSDLTSQTGRSPSRSATTASTAPSSAPRWVVCNHTELFPVIFMLLLNPADLHLAPLLWWCSHVLLLYFRNLVSRQHIKACSRSLKSDIEDI